ncbi:Nucleotidyltransferase domain [Musa troglodytarum]|uniref:Nucleotidyltransferase domain n=1 Tax=Musa troglodytarum TaxID=320322 RepID=A0A9E7HEQ0_9LILI|nr:Nucleotidyltransferase domain [Musa troglodytarum]
MRFFGITSPRRLTLLPRSPSPTTSPSTWPPLPLPRTSSPGHLRPRPRPLCLEVVTVAGPPSLPGFAPAAASRVPCFSSTRRSLIFVTLSHQPRRNKPHVMLLCNVYLTLSNISGHIVEVFGSFRTGLYLPTSDVDAVILESEVKTPQIGLYALARALSQRGVVIKMQVIAKARVPIIKFVEKRSGIAFDISFDVDSGPRAADFIKAAVQKIPPLRPLCMILKVFLHQRELNEVYSGGIGSYALLVMLIVFLQMHWRGQDSREYHQPMEHNLGILLVGFFEFFGRKLNSWDVGISCNSKSLFFVKNDKGFMNLDKPYLLSIEDPQAPDNDIGRNSYNYYKVRSALAMAYSTLTDAKAIMRLGPQRSVLGTIIRPDPLLLDRRGGNSGQLTFNNVLSGAGEPVARQFQNGDDVVYNWQLVDDEPLPREKVNVEDGSVLSSKRISKSRRRLGRSEKLEAFDSKHEEMSIKRASVVKRRKGSQHRDVFGK